MDANQDPLGYYRAFGVEPSATIGDLKKAFKAKAREFHPDINSAAGAAQKFRFVTEAYEVLGDPEKRAAYDTQSYEPARNSRPGKVSIDPISCSVCGKVSAQPRYVIYRQVMSFALVTRRGWAQGVFCPACGEKQAYKSSLTTWLLGWWGIPWGPIYSVHAIFSNMFGGEQTPLNNFRLLGAQAIYFSSVGKTKASRAVARDALRFSKKLPKSGTHVSSPDSALIGLMTGLIGNDEPNRPVPKLKNAWGLRRRPIWVQAGFAAVVIFVAAFFMTGNGIQSRKIAYRHVPPIAVPEEPELAPVSPVFGKPILELPATGRIWAMKNKGKPILAPLNVVTADDTQNYYLKVVSWQAHTPILLFFVRSGETASVNLPVGEYELHYAAGTTWYGEEYRFGPKTIYRKTDARLDFRVEGHQVEGYTVQLIKQLGGNLTETDLLPGEF